MGYISMIAALDKNGVIGLNGDLPWRLPADLRWFRRMTMGKPVIMGRKTYESIGKPLKGRTNIILTRNQSYRADGCDVVFSAETALNLTQDADETVIIGGSAIYELFFPLATRLYLTLVDAEVEGDTYFPEFDWGEWEIVSRERVSTEKLAFDWLILERLTT